MKCRGPSQEKKKDSFLQTANLNRRKKALLFFLPQPTPIFLAGRRLTERVMDVSHHQQDIWLGEGGGRGLVCRKMAKTGRKGGFTNPLFISLSPVGGQVGGGILL